MSSPDSLELADYCRDCTPGSLGFLCNLSPTVRKAFEDLSHPATYREATFLFDQEEEPRGVFVVCKGRVKISMTSADGKTVILRIAKPGEVVGLRAVVSGGRHQANAETAELSQILFVTRHDFLRFLREQPEAVLEVVRQLGYEYLLLAVSVGPHANKLERSVSPTRRRRNTRKSVR